MRLLYCQMMCNNFFLSNISTRHYKYHFVVLKSAKRALFCQKACSNLMWCPVEGISIRINGLSEFTIVWNEKRQQSEAELVKRWKKKRFHSDYSGWFGPRSSACEDWVDRVTFMFLSCCSAPFSHIFLLSQPKPVLFSLGIPRETLTNARKGGPWMTR